MRIGPCVEVIILYHKMGSGQKFNTVARPKLLGERGFQAQRSTNGFLTMAIKKRFARPTEEVPPIKYYLVTFDLYDSANRRNEYAQMARKLKGRFGAENFYDAIKQCAVVRTDATIEQVKNTVRQGIGGNSNILIAEVTNIDHAILDPERKRDARRLVVDLGFDKLL